MNEYKSLSNVDLLTELQIATVTFALCDSRSPEEKFHDERATAILEEVLTRMNSSSTNNK